MKGWPRQASSSATTLAVSVALSGHAFAQSAAIQRADCRRTGADRSGRHMSRSRTRAPARRAPSDSDAEGLYRFAGLPAGVYDVRASRDGFATVEQRADHRRSGRDRPSRSLAARRGDRRNRRRRCRPSPLIQTSSAGRRRRRRDPAGSRNSRSTAGIRQSRGDPARRRHRLSPRSHKGHAIHAAGHGRLPAAT